jgi:cytidyltransferase-like protein
MIINYEQLSTIREEAGELPVFFKAGTFDMLHVGHLNILNFLRSLGGLSVVGIFPNQRVVQRKGITRPIRDQLRRAEDIEAAGLADYVFVLPEGRFGVAKAVRNLQPTGFVEHESDTQNAFLKKSFLKVMGVDHIVSDADRICSTTDIINGRAPLSSLVQYGS